MQQPKIALALAAVPAFALFLHCAGKAKRTAESSPPVMMSAPTEAGIDAETGAGGAPTEEAAPRPDPVLVKKVLDRAGASAPDEAETLGLRFEVAEMGPHAAWGMAVVNRGTEAVEVVFDPRLLVLEVEPPPDPKAKKWTPKPKLRLCRLPNELRPARADKRFLVRLEPGHGMVEAFDARLYCLPEKGVSPLVAGAQVTARFGWAPKTKVVWKKGKREEELLPQTAPFVAALAAPLPLEHEDGGVEDDVATDAGDAGLEPLPAAEKRDAGAGGRAATRTEAVSDEKGVKELRGTRFELGSDYAAPKPESTAPEPLALELKSGSDALNETQATVTLAVVNRSKKSQQVYFRREFVTFEVSGPDGVTICDPQPDGRAPDRQAFTLLNSGGALTTTSRLIELCPDDAFARPGLYVVNAALDAVANGAEFGFDAFVGRLVSERPVVVRIRTGSLPFPGTRTLEEVKVGAPAP